MRKSEDGSPTKDTIKKRVRAGVELMRQEIKG